MLLQRYIDAERAYEEVLKLDPHCFDAEQEVHTVRIKHLTVRSLWKANS